MKKFLFLICLCLVTSTLFAQGKIEEYFFKNNGEQILFCQNIWFIYHRYGNRIVRLAGSGTDYPVGRVTQYVTISDNSIIVDETVSENQIIGKDVHYPGNVILKLPKPGQKTRWYDQYEKVYRTAELKVIKDSEGREIEVIKVTWNIAGESRTFHCMQYWGKGYGLIKDDWGTGVICYDLVMSGQWKEYEWYDLDQVQRVREQRRQEEEKRREIAVKKDVYEMIAASADTLSTNGLSIWCNLQGRTVKRNGVNVCEYSRPYVEFEDKDIVTKTLKSFYASLTLVRDYKVTLEEWEELKPKSIPRPMMKFSIMNDGTVKSEYNISDLFSTVVSSYIIPYRKDTVFLSKPVQINSNMLLKAVRLEYGECDKFEMSMKRIRQKGEYKYVAYVKGVRWEYDYPENLSNAIKKLASEEQWNDKWTKVSVFNYEHAKLTFAVVDSFADSIIAALDVTIPITVIARTRYWSNIYDRQSVKVATIVDYDNMDIKYNDSYVQVSAKYPVEYRQHELPDDLKAFIDDLMPVLESRDTAEIRIFLGDYALKMYDLNPMSYDNRTEYVGGELHKPDSDIWNVLASAIKAGGYNDLHGFVFPMYEDGFLKYEVSKSVEPHEAGVIIDNNVIVRDLPCENSGAAGRLSMQVVCVDRDFSSDGWCKVRTLDGIIEGYVQVSKIFRPDDMRVIMERDSEGCWKITGFRTWD